MLYLGLCIGFCLGVFSVFLGVYVCGRLKRNNTIEDNWRDFADYCRKEKDNG